MIQEKTENKDAIQKRVRQHPEAFFIICDVCGNTIYEDRRQCPHCGNCLSG